MPVNTDDLRNAIPSLYPDNLTGQIDAARMREGQRFVADVIDEAIGKTYSDEALASAATATGAAADAQASAVAAETARGLSQGHAIAAQDARDDAEAARDATTLIAATKGAYRDTTITAAIAQGVSALTVGDTFTAAADDVDYIGLYMINAGPVASEIAQLPTSLRVASIEQRIDASETIGRSTALVVGGGAASAGTYAFLDPITHDGTITRIQVYAGTGATLKVRRFTLLSGAMTQVGADTLLALSSGYNDLAVAITVNAGERIGFYTPAGTLKVVSTTGDSGGYSFSSSDVTTYTDTFSPRLTPQLQISFGVEQRRITQERLTDIEAGVAANSAGLQEVVDGLSDVTSQVTSAVESHPATAQFGPVSFGEYAAALLLDGVTEGTVIRSLTLYRQYVTATATKVRLELYQRPDGETLTIPKECTLVFTQDYAISDLGLTAGGVTYPNVTFAFPTPFIKKTGMHLAWMAQALDGADTPVGQSFGYLVDAGASQSERGWYRATASNPNLSTLAAPNRFASSVSRTGRSLIGAESPIVTTVTATATVSGTSIAVQGSGSTASGTAIAFAGSLTVAYAASGKERVDKIVLNRSTMALSVVAGTSRDAALDALEWQGATTSNSILIATVEVTSTTVIAQVVCNFQNMVKVGTEATAAWHVNRNRSILRNILGKAQRGSAIKLGGYGDSITAIQANTPAYTANGIYRDRATGAYLTSYPSDTKSLLTLYDTGDGAGQVHTRLGWNWNIKAALDAVAGSEVVTYLNYGIGATNSTATGSNGLLPARIAEPLGDDLDAVVIAFGMNERGQTYTYANIVNMIAQFQAVGTACVVMGCPRPNKIESRSAWAYTNDALEAAAMDAGAAYVSTQMIADDVNLGGIGVPAEVLASANTISGGNNHPGIWELESYGRAAILQLGI